MNVKTFKKIVVTTDFSELSTAAISYIRSFSAFSEATLYLVHVMESGSLAGLSAVDLPSLNLNGLADEDAAGEFAEFIRANVPDSLAIDAVIRHGEPAKEIISFATEIGADLIVIATHGRTGLSHILMGSVAERVIRSSAVPVLTIKPPSMREGMVEAADVTEQLHLDKRDDE